MICGYQFQDGVVCGQAHGHEEKGIPHLRFTEGGNYYNAKRQGEPIVEDGKVVGVRFHLR